MKKRFKKILFWVFSFGMLFTSMYAVVLGSLMMDAYLFVFGSSAIGFWLFVFGRDIFEWSGRIC